MVLILQKNLPGWNNWREKKLNKKLISNHINNILKKYIEKQDISIIDRTTFRYIYNFIENNEIVEILYVACYDFGYTIDELRLLKLKGKISINITKEIINHK